MTLHTLFETSLNKPLHGLFLRLFDIRKGELKRVVLMQVTIFLLIATLLIIKPTINALFLSDVGIEKLPVAFILVAVAAGLITTFYSRTLNKIPLGRVIQFSLIVSVIAVTGFSVLLRLNLLGTWILYVFYVWVAVFGVLSASQFWILANIVFNAREAKRLFSVIGGAAIGGGIFGGYLTSVLAPVIGSENLLFVGAGFLMACVPLTRAIWNSNQVIAQSVFLRKQRMGKVSEHPYRLILSSKHLSYLALITAISVLVAKLVEYQFSAISSREILNEDELAAFFGFWLSTINLLSLLIQLFVTRRVVGVYGVGISLFFLPFGILLGAVAIIITPALWSAIMIKASDGSLKQSVNKSAIELLAFPIPTEIKNQAKTFIDVFIDSLATGVGGLLLIFLINALNLPVRFVSVLIVLLLVVWIRLIMRIRREYVNQFKKKLNLEKEPLRQKGHALDLQNTSVYEGLTRVLKEGSDKQILYVLRNVNDLPHEKLFPEIKNLLAHSSPGVVAEAIRKLYYYKSENLSGEISRFVTADHQDLKIASIEYLIEHSGNRMDLIRQYLAHPDKAVASAAIMALANETRDNIELKRSSGLAELVAFRIENIGTATNEEYTYNETILLLRVIGASNLHDYYSFISESLKNPDPGIQESAIRAAGKTLDGFFLPELLSFLTNRELRPVAREAIAAYGYRIFDFLNEQISAGNLSMEIIRELPLIAEETGTQYGVDFLFALLEINDNIVRNQAIQSLARLKSAYPHLVFYNKRIFQNIIEEAKIFMTTLSALNVQQEQMESAGETHRKDIFEARRNLIDLLERRLDENLTRIFKFLGLKYPPEEIDSIYREIKNPKEEMRANAIEFLDNTLDTNLKKVLMPIMEASLSDSIAKTALNELKIKITNQGECFAMLLEGRDVKINLSVLYLLSVLKDRKYLSHARKYMNHPNERISEFARKAVQAMMSKS